jgi:hypothetical protein
MPYPADLAFHLRREVVPVTQPADTARVCDEPEQAVLVTQPWFWQPAPEPLCVARRGARHYRFHQDARGKETDVWVVPPRES